MQVFTKRELQHIFTNQDRFDELRGTEELNIAYAEYDEARKCGGCDAIMVEDSQYCWKCGLDLTHIDQVIINYETDYIHPVTTQKMYSKEQAAAARKWLRTVLHGVHGISVKMSPGYSGVIYVKLPKADHDCVTQSPDWKPWDPMRAQCPICTRHHKATRNLNNMLVAAFPRTSDKSDYMTDYFDFTWLVT